jgi:hypothetical protein
MKPPSPDTIFLPIPDPQYVLTAEQRVRVPGNVSMSALEQVMARVHPEFRDHFLDELRRFHEELLTDGKLALGPMTIRVEDPEIERFLRQLFRTG